MTINFSIKKGMHCFTRRPVSKLFPSTGNTFKQIQGRFSCTNVATTLLLTFDLLATLLDGVFSSACNSAYRNFCKCNNVL